LVYKEDLKVEIEKIRNMKNDVNVTIEYLIKKLNDDIKNIVLKGKVDNIKTIDKEIDDDDDNDDGDNDNDDDIEIIKKDIKKIENMKNINDVVERLVKKLDKKLQD
jgi:hypothetical protein